MSGNKNYNRYVYETSPRKLKPDYIPYEKQNPIQKKKSSTLKNTENKKEQKQEVKKNKAKKGKTKCFLYLAISFVILFAISYRNSQINESFSELKQSQEELALIQKENEQLEVNIENGLNLNNIEKMAKEKLGMQKLTNKQTKYISLPKKDYTEPASEQVIIEEEKSWIDNLMELLGIK